jgi:hypothetical protein
MQHILIRYGDSQGSENYTSEKEALTTKRKPQWRGSCSQNELNPWSSGMTPTPQQANSINRSKKSSA